MKQYSINIQLKKAIRLLVIPLVLVIFQLIPTALIAQEDSTATETVEAPAEIESSLIAPSIEFLTVQKADSTIDLTAVVRGKVNGNAIKFRLLKITFFQVTDSAENELGYLITDKNGKAVFNVKPGTVMPDAEGKLHFKAVFAGNKSMESAEEEITIKRARIEVTPIKEDSLLTMQVKLIDVGTGTEIPVPETEVGIYVKRMINPLKVGEGTTDENGEVTIEIPSNLPGDAKGNLTFYAKLEENETYGNLEASVNLLWGTPVSDQFQKVPRSLWSSNPPIWMVITFAVLMIAVWGHYIVIIYELFRLRKEEPPQPPDATNIEKI